MKEIKQAVVLVDSHKPLRLKHNTAGRYRVGAKTEKEAEELVRKAIGFGSVKFYYWDEKTPDDKKMTYKQIVKEISPGEYRPVRHANAPMNNDSGTSDAV